jgi:hypothetical protein
MSPRRIRRTYNIPVKRKVEGEGGEVSTRRVFARKRGLKKGLRGALRVGTRDFSTRDPLNRGHRHGTSGHGLEIRPGENIESAIKKVSRRWRGLPPKSKQRD